MLAKKLKGRLSVRILRSKHEDSICRNRIQERTLGYPVHRHRHRITGSIENVDPSLSRGAVLIYKRDLRRPSAGGSELGHNDRRAAGRGRSSGDRQCAEVDPGEPQTKHGKWSRALQLETSPERRTG